MLSLLKISQLLAQQATFSGGLTVSFQLENILMMKLIPCHLSSDRVWKT